MQRVPVSSFVSFHKCLDGSLVMQASLSHFYSYRWNFTHIPPSNSPPYPPKNAHWFTKLNFDLSSVLYLRWIDICSHLPEKKNVTQRNCHQRGTQQNKRWNGDKCVVLDKQHSKSGNWSWETSMNEEISKYSYPFTVILSSGYGSSGVILTTGNETCN